MKHHFLSPLPVGTGDDWPLEHIYRSHSGCKPLSYRPMAIVPCFHAQGVRRIVIIGDSLLRQFVGRFVSLSRIQRVRWFLIRGGGWCAV